MDEKTLKNMIIDLAYDLVMYLDQVNDGEFVDQIIGAVSSNDAYTLMQLRKE